MFGTRAFASRVFGSSVIGLRVFELRLNRTLINKIDFLFFNVIVDFASLVKHLGA